MAREDASRDRPESRQQEMNRQPAGSEPDRNPDRPVGGKRPHAGATRGQQLGADTDGDLDGDMDRQSRGR
ncbi:MAG: hypothetical protein HOQ02_02160 [Lysobacter sp.]|nr:hypothetical protein [Lysobacter sp.]